MVAGTPRVAGPAELEPAEDDLSGVEKFGLVVFFVCAFIATTRVTLAPLLGEWVLALATASVPGGALGIAITVLRHAQRADAPGASKLASTWAQLITGHVILLVILGVVEEHLPADITRDAIPYVVIAMFATLGQRSAVWRFTESAALWIGLLAVPINLVGLDLTDIVGRDTVHSEAYRTQAALGLWPLLLVALPSQPRSWRRLAAASLPFFVLVEQLFFLKRAPTVRVALVIVLLLFVAPSFAQARWRGGLVLVLGGLTALTALTVGAWGEMLGTAASSLGSRFQGDSGLSATLIEDNGRITEVIAWADSTEDVQWVMGRGMGSYFTHVDVTDFVQSEVDAQGSLARRALHIGAFDPIFRGGLLFAVLYFGAFAIALSRVGLAIALARAGEQNSRTLSGALFLFVYLAFQLTEGAPTTSFYFDLTVIGLALGRLLSTDPRGTK